MDPEGSQSIKVLTTNYYRYRIHSYATNKTVLTSGCRNLSLSLTLRSATMFSQSEWIPLNEGMSLYLFMTACVRKYDLQHIHIIGHIVRTSIFLLKSWLLPLSIGASSFQSRYLSNVTKDSM